MHGETVKNRLSYVRKYRLRIFFVVLFSIFGKTEILRSFVA